MFPVVFASQDLQVNNIASDAQIYITNGQFWSSSGKKEPCLKSLKALSFEKIFQKSCVGFVFIDKSVIFS